MLQNEWGDDTLAQDLHDWIVETIQLEVFITTGAFLSPGARTGTREDLQGAYERLNALLVKVDKMEKGA